MAEKIELRCIKVIQAISEYIDGGLDPEFTDRISAHIKDCAHCTAILHGTKNLIELVADGRVLEVPANFSGRIFDKLRAHLRRASREL